VCMTVCMIVYTVICVYDRVYGDMCV